MRLYIGAFVVLLVVLDSVTSKKKGKGPIIVVPLPGDDNLVPLPGDDDNLIPLPGPITGPSLVEDRKAAEELQTKIETVHTADPRSAVELAYNVLGNVFSMYHKKTGGMNVKVTEVIEKLMDTTGKTSIFILRLLSFMDKNHDYTITKEEFAKFFESPFAHPHRMLELMHRMQDFNGDGVLNKYSFLWSEMLSLGPNYPLLDLWRTAESRLAEIDTNEDGLVDTGEFTNWVIFHINKAIVKQRLNSKPSKAGAKDDKSHDDKSPDDKSPDDKSPDDKSPDDKSPDNKSPDDKSPDDKSPDDKSPDDKSADENAPAQ